MSELRPIFFLFVLCAFGALCACGPAQTQRPGEQPCNDKGIVDEPFEAAERWTHHFARLRDRSELLPQGPARDLASSWKGAAVLRVWEGESGTYQALIGQDANATQGQGLLLKLVDAGGGQGWSASVEGVADVTTMWPGI